DLQARWEAFLPESRDWAGKSYCASWFLREDEPVLRAGGAEVDSAWDDCRHSRPIRRWSTMDSNTPASIPSRSRRSNSNSRWYTADSPLFAGNPDVAEPRSPDPVTAAIGLPIARSCFIGRPDIALSWNVVPVAVGIQVTPGGVVAVGFASTGGGPGSLLSCQILIAIGVPGIPGIRFDGLREIVNTGIAGVE